MNAQGSSLKGSVAIEVVMDILSKWLIELLKCDEETSMEYPQITNIIQVLIYEIFLEIHLNSLYFT